jgi:hypothetical protein
VLDPDPKNGQDPAKPARIGVFNVVRAPLSPP